MKPKIISLIGGAGFIGHNLALALKKRGHVPFIVDSLAVNNVLSFNDFDIKNRKLYRNILNQRLDLLHENAIEVNVEDARDYDALSQLLGSFIKPDVIVQLAAVSHANKANKNPHSTFDHSLRTLENALDYAKGGRSSNYEPRVEKFIFLSSSMVYGNFPSESVSEKEQCNPLGIYGTVKYAGELLVKAYHQVFDLPYTIIRPSALYGERCVSRRVGQIFIENVLRGEEINIRGNGSDRLDFTYIGDFVSGMIKIIEGDKAVNETFNITYGESRTLGELAEIVANQFPHIKINYLQKEKLTPDRGTLNVDKARELVGYEPKFPIEEGFPKYIDWYNTFWDSMHS
ncbi:MAG: NAD(P)-dependent oxidoreductase [Dehalococcoidia bacterium]|jgi:nucleoside-diphosphate-sugar epimerase|nr:NAD(P)-dependent oxidoreductase [Dehalococcoidia bacterium]|tara:strand:+ start:5995 stop:7026 length:1032 start_codon:yes stop_codon:yes gene_type:complete